MRFFRNSSQIFGQKSVSKGMENNSNKNTIEALFLVGDNVYPDNIVREELIKMVNEQNYPSESQYRQNNKISSQNIEKQLEEGFLKCFSNISVKDFFITIGNHHIENCHNLNYQLNYNQDLYKLP